MENLKPCPFCGGEAIISGSEEQTAYFVSCTTCDAQTAVITSADYGKVKEKAAATWNNRAELAGLTPERVAELAAAEREKRLMPEVAK
jgi:Lar family restriction alleviation protein